VQEDVHSVEADRRKKGHQQEGDEDDPMKKKTASSHEDAPQKPDHLHTPERCPDANGGSRGLLSHTPDVQRMG
jgi:hypothetical protein